MGRASKEKGKRGERALVKLLRLYGVEAKRRGGQQAGDPADAPDVDVAGIWLECKVGKRPIPLGALEQACSMAPIGRVPVAVTKRDRGPWVATLLLQDLLELTRGGSEGTGLNTATGEPIAPPEDEDE